MTPLKINSILTKENYQKTYDKYYHIVMDDFSKRNKLVSIEFGSGSIVKMKLSKFLVNMIFWKPFMQFNKELTKDYIFDTSIINSDEIAKYIDKLIYNFLTDENQQEVNFCIADIIKYLGYFSLDFNEKIGNTISMYDIIQLSKNNPEFNELIHTRYGNNLNTEDIELDLKDKSKKMLNILGKEKNCFQDYVNSKEGLHNNQLTQFLINIGPKPDLVGKVYPRIVDTNFITDGIKSPSDYFINSSGGRKASIVNASKVKTSGYLMRKLAILCMNMELGNIDDCGSENYINVLLDSDRTMERYDKRYYMDEEDDELKLFDYNESNAKKFKNKTIKFRSPITCACKDGKVCKKCYGDLAMINYNIHIGILAIEILTSQITQLMLSTKHMLKTDTKKINWNSRWNELFNINGDTITRNETLETPSKYSLIINEDMINDNEDGLSSSDDEDDFNDETKIDNVTKYFKHCAIKYKEDRNREEIIQIDNETDIYLSPYFENILKEKASVDDDGTYELNMKDVNLNKPLFYVEIENNGLDTVLNSIIELIDKKERLGTTTYDEMINKFIELTNDSNIIINAVHMELILRELIKSTDDILIRPDFSKPNPEYQILRLTSSIINSNSVITSLSFERLKEQIYSAKTYRKNGKSLFDNFFL